MSTGSSDDYTGKESSCSSSLRRARAAKRKQAILRDKEILEGRLSHIGQTLASIDDKLNHVLSAQSGSIVSTTRTASAAAPLPPPGLVREQVSEIDEAMHANFSEFDAAEPEVASYAMHRKLPVKVHTTIGVQTETLQTDTSVLELQIAFLEVKIIELDNKPGGVCDGTQTKETTGISISTQTPSKSISASARSSVNNEASKLPEKLKTAKANAASLVHSGILDSLQALEELSVQTEVSCERPIDEVELDARFEAMVAAHAERMTLFESISRDVERDSGTSS